MSGRAILIATLLAASGMTMIVGDASAQEKWKPAKTISVIVPWPAGGASDTVARMTSGVMEQTLGQRMVIVNTPGGAGAIGTKEVWDKPHDGYTLTANATVSVGSYAVLGKLDQTHRDWIYYLPIFTPNVICVKADSPIKTVDDLVAAMKAKPNGVVLASAGVGSSGYFAGGAVQGRLPASRTGTFPMPAAFPPSWPLPPERPKSSCSCRWKWRSSCEAASCARWRFRPRRRSRSKATARFRRCRSSCPRSRTTALISV